MAILTPLADPILNWLRGTTFGAAPTTIYISLHNGTPPTSVNEVSGNVGGRVAMTSANFTTPADSPGVIARQITNSTAVVFGTCNAELTVTSFGIWSASTAGNFLISGDVVPDVLLRVGDPAIFSIGDLIIRIG